MEEQNKMIRSALSSLIALQVLTLVAVLTATWYSNHTLLQFVSNARISAGGQQRPQDVENWAAYVRGYNASEGDADSSIVLVEFSDFQCPYCRQFATSTRNDLVARYGDDVRFVFKNFPLSQVHPDAEIAAIAAQCAAREGRFWDMHERLFGQQSELGKADLLETGMNLGLSERYAQCVLNEETRPEIEQDIADAAALGVAGTPTFMVNGKFLVGAQSEVAFESVIEAAEAANE